MTGNHTYKAELHCHTTASDGQLQPIELVQLARKKQLNAVAVTDHNTWRGSVLAQRAAKLIGEVMVVPGNEVRTNHGDVLVLCPEPAESTPMELEELRDWASDHNCILIAAHPFHPGRKSLMKSLYTHLKAFDAIEVWNSRGIPILNYPAIRTAEKHGIPGTSGSDAHVGRELGLSPVILPDKPERPEDVIEWIRRGRVRPTFGLPGPLAIAEIVAWSIYRRL